MDYLWQTHLGSDVSYDAIYHQSPRKEIASFFNDPPGVVLDIGCGGGGAGKQIKEKFPGTKVIGIELNKHAAEQARQHLDLVICESIDTLELTEHIGSQRIDTVLLLDVLEHLYDPWRALVRIRNWLEQGTRVLASLPNIRNLANLDELAGGNWTYGANGVLDITHVRFFTRSSLRKLFEETGYVVQQMIPLTQPEALEPRVVDRRPGQIVTRNMAIKYQNFEELEELYALQYVIDARPAPGVPLTTGGRGR
jgi:2-polyprenyl-3-methyl-5-hydroxy-6-metoxy-1,4-benzoquinol methylase